MAVLVLSSKSQGSQRFSTEFGNALLSHAFLMPLKSSQKSRNTQGLGTEFAHNF